MPAGFFFAGEFGEVGEGLVKGGVEVAELGEKLVADAVAGEGGVGIGGVVSPGLVELAEVGLDLGAADAEQGTEDIARAGWGIVDQDDGVDAAESFSPGSAEELHEDGFGLVVEGMGGENGVGLAGGDERGKEVVADVACGFFDGFGAACLAGLSDAVGNAGLVDVERDVEAGAEVGDELLVGIGLGCAEAVVDVDGGEADAEGVSFGAVGGVESEEKGHGVCTTGDGGTETVAGFDVCAGEGEDGSGWHG